MNNSCKILWLTILTIIVVFLQPYLIDVNSLYLNSYSSQLDENSINSIINSYNRYHLFSYPLTIVMLLVKLSLISLLFYAGIYMKKIDVSCKSMLTVILNSEYILIAGSIISILFISLTNSHPTITDLYTPPFSVLALFKSSEVEPWLRYPFSLLNIFEVFYWVALIVQWKKLTGKTYGESFDFIGSTYGLGLLLWVLVVVFFTI